MKVLFLILIYAINSLDFITISHAETTLKNDSSTNSTPNPQTNNLTCQDLFPKAFDERERLICEQHSHAKSLLKACLDTFKANETIERLECLFSKAQEKHIFLCGHIFPHILELKDRVRCLVHKSTEAQMLKCFELLPSEYDSYDRLRCLSSRASLSLMNQCEKRLLKSNLPKSKIENSFSPQHLIQCLEKR